MELNKIDAVDVELLEIGNSIHLVASVWKDVINNKTYILPIAEDFEIGNNLIIVEADSDERLKWIRQSDVIESRVYEGAKRKFVKGIIKKSQSHVEPNLIWEVFRRDGFTCVYCNRKDTPMTFDHYVPRSLGGITSVENGRTSCRRCNNLKSDRSPEEWYSSIEYERVSCESKRKRS